MTAIEFNPMNAGERGAMTRGRLIEILNTICNKDPRKQGEVLTELVKACERAGIGPTTEMHTFIVSVLSGEDHNNTNVRSKSNNDEATKLIEEIEQEFSQLFDDSLSIARQDHQDLLDAVKKVIDENVNDHVTLTSSLSMFCDNVTNLIWKRLEENSATKKAGREDSRA